MALQRTAVLLLIAAFLVCPLHVRSEDRLGPYDDGLHRRSSTSTLPPVVSLVAAHALDPLKRQNPTQSAQRGSRWGSTRARNITSRNGEIALLIPGTTTTDVGIFSETGDLLRRFPTALTRSTRGEWNTSGPEGRDLRPGQFTNYWDANGTLHFRSSGDFLDRVSLDAVSGAAQPVLGQTEFNAHGYFGMSDSSPFVLIPRSGHGMGSKTMTYFAGSTTKSQVTGSSFTAWNNFTNPTPLMSGGELFLLHATRLTIETSATYDTGFGVGIRQYLWDATNSKFQMGWLWQLPENLMVRGADGATSSYPWCMDSNSIYLVTHPTVAEWSYPHFDPAQPTSFRVIDRQSGIQVQELELSDFLAAPQDIYSSSFQLGMTSDSVAILSVAASSTSITKLRCIDREQNSVRWSFDFQLGETSVNETWKSETTKLYCTPSEVCTLSAKTNSTKKWVVLTLNRFNAVSGARTKQDFNIAVPGVDTTAYVEDFAIINGRAYALVTYREFVAGGTFTGGGQLFVVLGTP